MKLGENLEPLTVHDFDVSEPVCKLVLAVLEAIPETCAEEFPSFSVVERKSPLSTHVEREEIDDVAVLCIDPQLAYENHDIALGTLAHEFAHIFLGHTGHETLDDEYAADAMARRWGFTKEVDAMRSDVGPPTEDKNVQQPYHGHG